MRVSVIGSGGLLGNAVVRVFSQCGDIVQPLDLPEYDVTDHLFLGKHIAAFQPDAIINASGLNDIDWIEEHQNSAININVRGTAMACEIARSLDVMFVQCSCMECEDSDSVFAQTRRDAEQAATEYERHLVVRCSTLFGNVGERSRGGIVATVLQAARRTRKFHAIDDVICSPTYTNHLATAIRDLLSNRDTGIKKIANEGQATPAELLNQLSKQTGLPLEIKPIPSSELKQTAKRSSNTSIVKSDVTLPHWNDALREFLDSRIKQC